MFAAIMLFVSCKRDVFEKAVSINEDIAHIQDSFFVDQNAAKLIAENINRSQLIQNKVITTKNKTVSSLYLVKKSVRNDVPLLEKGIPYFYVFNYADGGFAIVSSSKRTMPVLGYSEKGSFDKDSVPLGVILWLDLERSSVQNLRDSHTQPNETILETWDVMGCPPPPLSKVATNSNTTLLPCTPNGSPVETIKGPLLSTKWDQGCGYNNYAPTVSDGPCGYAYTGCVATSVSQVMNYWKYPNSYNWTLMSNDYGSNECAKLMHDVGVAVDMDYGGYSVGGSSASHSKVPGALKNTFHYSSATHGGFNYNTIVSNISNGMPVILGGCQSKNSVLGITYKYNECHSWVCNGYWRTEYGTYSTSMLYMNWGWSGAYNGWYAVNSYQIADGSNFQYGLDMVYDIHP